MVQPLTYTLAWRLGHLGDTIANETGLSGVVKGMEVMNPTHRNVQKLILARWMNNHTRHGERDSGVWNLHGTS